jgi:hypothetical protein
MGKKALTIRLANLRRDDIPLRIMNQGRAIAKEKSSFKGRSLLLDRAIPQHNRPFGPKSGTIQILVLAAFSELYEVCRGILSLAFTTFCFPGMSEL